jgi:hydroxymethylpyrimidine/phosphomethylpyrimidine kinase
MITLVNALTIAGSDTISGSGIQGDLKTFSALGIYGTTVITAITAQNTRCITDVYPLDGWIINRQIPLFVMI